MRTVRINYFVFLFTLFSVLLHAQQLSEADVWFDAQDYCKAKPVYGSVLKNKPYDANLNLKYGLCLFYIGDYHQALKPLELAARKIPQANVCIGDIYFNNYHFAEAKEYYDKALSVFSPESKEYADCLIKLEKTASAQRMLSSVEDLQIMDSLVVDKKEFYTFYELSKDAGRLFKSLEYDSLLQVSYTGFIPERGDRMFYVDTVLGNSDIFQSNKLLDGWSKKQSLSNNVNTTSNENFPFLMPDGITLYYASDGASSIGGFDIFVTRFRSDTNDFLSPENVGMPFNSPYNDYLLVIDEFKAQGWFASDRYQPKGKVIIYRFKTKPVRKEISVEDVEQRIRFAKLKEYHIFHFQEDSALADTLDSVPVLHTEDFQLKKMAFVINDTLIYSSIKDFKSEKALSVYREGVKLDEKIQYVKSVLMQKRNEYGASSSSEERQRLLPDLLALEKELNNLSAQPNTYLKDARNLEIEKLNELRDLPSIYDFNQ